MSTEKPLISFPPYGAMNQNDGASAFKQVPTDWVPLAQDPGATLLEKWSNWLDAVVEQINEVLWPAWDTEHSGWKPARSVEHMEALTRADLKVLAHMQRARLNRGLDRMPDSPNRSESIRAHRQILIIEDGRPLDDDQPVIGFLSYYDKYDWQLPSALSAQVTTLWFNATHNKLRTIPYLVKRRLQRPRPYQLSMMLGHPDYVYEFAETALTPSSCSGHCLQGLTGMGGVYEYFNSSGIKLGEDNLDSMRQCAVDIGDRRVMAGIHYPSDNLCSWIILMNLADRVYRDAKVKAWLWKAINERSWVYESILEYHNQEHGQSVYKPALDHLHSLAPHHHTV